MRPSDETIQLILREQDPLVIAKANLFVSVGGRVEYMEEEQKELYYGQINTFIKELRKKHAKKDKLQRKNQKPKPRRIHKKRR
jgi:hypothetical protein